MASEISQKTNQEHDYPFFDGYIIELKETPLALKAVELKSESNFKLIQKKDITNKISEHRQKIKNQHEQLKSARNVIKKKKKQNSVTGNLIPNFPPTLSDKDILGEFTTTFNGLALNITKEEAEDLRKLDYVKAIYPNKIAHTLLMTSVPIVGAVKVWELDSNGHKCAETGMPCLTGTGINIGIIDTGVDYTHPDLGGCFGVNCKVAGGYDFYNEDANPMDDNGHGTHVASIAAGNGILKGVAPGANIIAYKVCDGSGQQCPSDRILSAIEKSIDPNQDGDFSDHLDIISMSLGGTGDMDDPLSRAVDAAVDSGVIAVVAAGNSGPTQMSINSPGVSRNAITVGAVDKIDRIASFSSIGPVDSEKGIFIKPDIVAPGVFICAARYDNISETKKCLDERHISLSGTSMATPHVAGAAAILKQKHRDWTPDEIKSVIKNNAKDLNYNISVQGYGRIDLQKSIEANIKPCISKISRIYRPDNNTGIISIVGSVHCDDFESYTISISDSYSDMPSLTKSNLDSIPAKDTYSSANSITNGVIYSINGSSYNDGYAVIRLKVRSRAGDEYADFALAHIENLKLNEIGRLGGYVKGKETVSGSTFLDYTEYKFEYKPYESFEPDSINRTQWIAACHNIGKVSSVMACTVDFAQLANGAYHVRVSAKLRDKWLSSQPTKIVVLKELIDGWPVEINGFIKGLPNIGTMNGTKKLVVPHYNWCDVASASSYNNENLNASTDLDRKMTFKKITNPYSSEKSDPATAYSCSGNSIYVYNSDGSFKFINSLTDNSPPFSLYNTVGDDKPAILGGETEFFSFISLFYQENFQQGYPIGGVADLTGRFYQKWLDSSPDEYAIKRKSFRGPLSIQYVDKLKDDIFFDIKFNPGANYIITSQDNDIFQTTTNQNISTLNIQAFDKSGRLLNNFPIRVSDEEIGQTFASTGVRVVKKNNSQFIAIAGGSSLSNGTKMAAFVDIYSMEGQLINRFHVFDNDGKVFLGGMTSLVITDYDNDGNSELALGLSITDNDLSSINPYRPDAYKTFFYSINLKGDSVTVHSGPSGYRVLDLVPSGLGQDFAYISTMIGYTFLSSSADIIHSFDISGNSRYSTAIPNDKYIGGIAMGDVDSDGAQELVISYMPKSDYEDSGFYIYSLNGMLKKNLAVPTTGKRDYFLLMSPMLADFNNDGRIDIIQQSSHYSKNVAYISTKTRIFALSLDGVFDKNKLSWPMKYHDPQHTGSNSVVTANSCPWDVFGSGNEIPDGKITLGDVLFVLKDYGKKPGDFGYDSRKNFNSNPQIDLGDIITVLNHFGNCP